jgi:predicted kinase
MNEPITKARWFFPFCPTPPQWTMRWDDIEARFSWIRAMDGIPQSPIYHAEGNVLIHTRMVAQAMVELGEWRGLPDEQRMLLFASALLHDVAKPQCTTTEADGHISSRGHARKGELQARHLLWTGSELDPAPLQTREYIARLVRWHGLPLQFLDKPEPERMVIAASQSIRMDHLAMLAEADVRGRICADQEDLLTRVALFREFCRELACYDAPRTFPDNHSRFVYFHSEQGYPDYAAYDDTSFEVVMLSGLPGAGKDTWLHEHLQGRPIIALDQIRAELKIGPEENQGRVIQVARERARELMRQQRSFAWNATNITRMLRQQLIDFFVGYGARVRLVYLDVPFATLLKRNQERRASLPEAVIHRLANKLEVPDVTEAHSVEWVEQDA